MIETSIDRPRLKSYPSRQRSRITNGSLLPSVTDGRSAWVRRVKDVIELHISDLGGEANSAYRNVTLLDNPAKDAASMATLFKEAGFDTVAVETNVGNVDFKRAIRNFEDTAIDSDIAVVFYTGHGIEIGGANYLVPVDAKLATDSDVPEEAISLARLVDSVKGAKRLRLIILDANRANPFIKTTVHESGSGTKRTWRDVRLESVMRAKADVHYCTIRSTLARFRRGAGADFGLCRCSARITPIRANIVGMLSILVCHLPKSAKHVRIVEFAYLEIASAAVRDRTSMAKYLPKSLRTLYRSGWTRAINGFTRSDSAINEIEGQRPERNDFCHRPPNPALTIFPTAEAMAASGDCPAALRSRRS
jgi:Caspase domain